MYNKYICAIGWFVKPDDCDYFLFEEVLFQDACRGWISFRFKTKNHDEEKRVIVFSEDGNELALLIPELKNRLVTRLQLFLMNKEAKIIDLTDEIKEVLKELNKNETSKNS